MYADRTTRERTAPLSCHAARCIVARRTLSDQRLLLPACGLFGSFNQLMDYCPIVKAYSNGDCRNESNVETDSNSRCPNEYRE